MNHRLQPHRRNPLWKGALGTQGVCCRRPGLSFSHCVPISLFLSQCFSLAHTLFLVASLFLSIPWLILTPPWEAEAKPGALRHRDQGAGPDTWRPSQAGGGSGNPGQTPVSDPLPGPARASLLSLPATFPCFLSGKAISDPACLGGARPPPRSWQTGPLPFGPP